VGGEDKFVRLMRFAHPQVEHIDFSPGERFLVTYSSHKPSNPRDTHKVVLNIFDVRTGKLMRDFKEVLMYLPLLRTLVFLVFHGLASGGEVVRVISILRGLGRISYLFMKPIHSP